ncbi:uncharacterized protein LOC144448958 [Glandiceps talaboti]
MLDPTLPWLAVGYRKFNKNNFYRRRYEKEDYSAGFDDSTAEDGLRVSTPVTHQRQRIQSATLHRHYDTMHSRASERPKSAQQLRYYRDNRPHTPTEQTTVSRISPRRRVKSAGHPTRRNIVVDLKKSYTLVERFYHEEKLKHVNEHEAQTVDQCHYCPVECRPPSSSTNRPTSSTGLVAARLPTHFDRFIYWTRPRTAPGTRKEFLQLPKHNNVRRGRVPHYTNFVKRIELGIRDRTPSPPRSRHAERPKSASVMSAVSGGSFRVEQVSQPSEEDLDWQEMEIRDEGVVEDDYAQEIVEEPIHIPTPTPQPTEPEEVEPPEEIGQAWLEPHAPTPTPVASEGPASPPPEREPTPPPLVIPTQIDIPAREPTPPPKEPSPPPSPKIKKEVRIQEDIQTIPTKPKVPKEKKEKKIGPIKRVSAKKEIPEPPTPKPPPPPPPKEIIEETKPVEVKEQKPVEKPDVVIPALPEIKEKEEPEPEEPKEKESTTPDVQEPEPESIPEPQEERKKLSEPPRGKAQDLFALDPQELLDMEMRMRRRGPDSHISDSESLLTDMPNLNDTLDKKPKMQPWLQGRLAFSKQTSRFEIPMDVRVLERMTPVEYLTRYCIISTRRLAFYRRHFNRVDRDNDLKINRKEVETGMKAVHVDSISVEQIDKMVEMLEIDEQTYKFNFKIFAALCALSERLLYPKFVTEDTVHLAEHQKEKVEDADFEALDWKLDGCQVNPPVKRILYML